MALKPASGFPRVAIVGGGWAGLACAAELCQAGYQPVVFESAPEAGGRARSAWIQDAARDNGQHLMLSGCASLTSLFILAGISLPTTPFVFESGSRRLSVPANAGRIGLAVALLQATGFSAYERIRLIFALIRLQLNGWSVSESQTVADWLSVNHQPNSLIKEFWEPLALAILNTPLKQAAMARLAPVLRDTLGRGGKALCLLQPTGNLTESVVNPLVDFIKARGGQIHLGQRVTSVFPAQNGYELHIKDLEQKAHFDQVVLAIPPWALDKIELPEGLDNIPFASRFGSQPIATVYLGFNPSYRLPAPLLQIDGPTEADARLWVMDRAHCGEPGVVAVSISAEGRWCELDTPDLAKACLRSLQLALPNVPECLWHKAVVVHRATYKATPEANIAADDSNPMPQLYLAGDWTHTSYPATLEAAVATGLCVARRIIAANS